MRRGAISTSWFLYQNGDGYENAGRHGPRDITKDYLYRVYHVNKVCGNRLRSTLQRNAGVLLDQCDGVNTLTEAVALDALSRTPCDTDGEEETAHKFEAFATILRTRTQGPL